eukprot:6106559-Amphidinium_carterae.1
MDPMVDLDAEVAPMAYWAQECQGLASPCVTCSNSLLPNKLRSHKPQGRPPIAHPPLSSCYPCPSFSSTVFYNAHRK